ncbi:MAG: transposase, partial [Thermodesulfobacteriota bacterium]|nr:transposase [Thermodesulfobacteriota bacterium]
MLTFLRTATGIEDGVLGAVMTIHTFGDYCRWHPHVHGIVADGLFYGNGKFYVMPKKVEKSLLLSSRNISRIKGHWFSLIGKIYYRILNGYAILILKRSCGEIRCSITPKATAGT